MIKNNGFHNRHSPILRFSPLSLFSGGTPGAWYDPSDFGTMFQDSAGTIPVTAVEQPVGLVLDKSGSGNNAFQTTSASRPLLKIDGSGNYYWNFDGVDDSFVTNNINLASTDKLSIFAGIQKVLNDATGIVAEFSANVNDNNGTFAYIVSAAPTVGNYRFRSRGTQSATVDASGYVAPITNIFTGLGDISGDVATIRIDGTQAATSAADQGSGNYGNHPLYIGRRNNTSLPLNGRIYSLIIVGKAVTAGELSSAETYVNQKTGAY